MIQKIYLSRHGITLEKALAEMRQDYFDREGQSIDNANYDPKLSDFCEGSTISRDSLKKYLDMYGFTTQELEGKTGYDLDSSHLIELHEITPSGRQQARILGNHLSSNSQPFTIVTSSAGRTVDTAHEIAMVCEYTLREGNNHYAFDELRRRAPFKLLNGLSPEGREWLKKAREFATEQEIANETYQIINDVALKHPDKDILAILHESRNMSFLSHYGIDPSPIRGDYCGLLTLHFSQGKVLPVGDYLANDSLTRALPTSVCF